VKTRSSYAGCEELSSSCASSEVRIASYVNRARARRSSRCCRRRKGRTLGHICVLGYFCGTRTAPAFAAGFAAATVEARLEVAGKVPLSGRSKCPDTWSWFHFQQFIHAAPTIDTSHPSPTVMGRTFALPPFAFRLIHLCRPTRTATRAGDRKFERITNENSCDFFESCCPSESQRGGT
jgi:hypothetical protein